jgi:hypothetical protein
MFFSPNTTVAIPCSGRLPLTEAIASGLPWNLLAAAVEGHRSCSNEEDRAVATDNIMDNDYYNGEETIQQGPLQSLWDAAPDAMEQNDLVTGLRPFTLAATMQHQQQTNSMKEGSQICCKSTPYIPSSYWILPAFVTDHK